MPDQHREFFALLPYLFVATPDADGWPMASVLTGEPGFVQSPIRRRLASARCRHRRSGRADLHRRRRGRPFRPRLHHAAAQPRQRPAGRGRQGTHGRDRPELRQLRAIHPDAHALAACCCRRAGAPRPARRRRARPDRGVGHLLRRQPVAGRRRRRRPRHVAPRRQAGLRRRDGDTLAIPDFRGNRFYNTLGNLRATRAPPAVHRLRLGRHPVAEGRRR